MVKLAVEALEEKKGEDVKIIDIEGVSVIADYFVLASASNANQTQALVDNVEEKLFKAGYECHQKEGSMSSTWVLMDYGDVIVHVFSKEDRLFYDLERIWRDGKIVDVENEAGVGFINQPITGKLELTKTDVADGKPLPNAGFRIKDEDGNIVATGVTDENGIAIFTLRYGKYTYQEYNAPEGYEIDESEYAFEIKEDGQIVKATMTNEKIPEELITTPKTGDDSRPGLWIGLSALSGAGVAAFGILTAVKMRKRKEEDKA